MMNVPTTRAPDGEPSTPVAELDDRARDLVSEHGRRGEGDLALDHVEVGVADAAGGDAHEHLAAARARDRDLLDLQRLTGRG